MKNRKFMVGFIVFALILNIFLFFPQKRILSFKTLSTTANITIENVNFIKYKKLKIEIEKYCAEFERKYSVSYPESLVYKLNKHKKSDFTDEIFKNLIISSLEMAKHTDGLFDITIQPLISLWGFDTILPLKPENKSIKRELEKVGYKNIKLSDKNIFLENNAEITLGGVGKGLLIDIIYSYLKELTSEFIVEIGGDLKVFSKNQTRIFKIGIKNPVSNGMIEIIDLKSGQAVATSGNYERFFEDENGDIFHHIINPVTGYPENKYKQVTVVHNSCMMADMLSTAFFLMDEKEINNLKEKYKADYVKLIKASE
ncbi:MAG: FAD:protein FMN transferase [Candidatus Muiribacteriota bacterium]